MPTAMKGVAGGLTRCSRCRRLCQQWRKQLLGYVTSLLTDVLLSLSLSSETAGDSAVMEAADGTTSLLTDAMSETVVMPAVMDIAAIATSLPTVARLSLMVGMGLVVCRGGGGERGDSSGY